MRWKFWQRPSTLAATPAAADRPPEPADLRVPRSWRSYPVDGITPRRLTEIEREADRGRPALLMELFDDVAKDAHVAAELQKARLAVAGQKIVLSAGDDSDAAAEIATAAGVFLGRIPQRSQLLVELLDAEYRGFSAVQPRWTGERGAWWVTAWSRIEQRFFRFEGEQILVETAAYPEGEPLPEGVLFHAVGSGPEITRGGFGRSLLKPWIYRGYASIDGMSFLERFGHPHVQVELPPHLQEGSVDLERAKAAARAIIVDNYALVPAGVNLKILDVAQKAATVKDVYLAFVEWTEHAISKAINGQTLTTAVGDKGSFAAAKVHEAQGQLLVEQRAMRLGELLTAQLLRPWTRYHFGAEAPVPVLTIDVAPPADAKLVAETERTRAETLAILVETGVEIAERQVRSEFRLVLPEKGEARIGGARSSTAATARASSGAGICPHCSTTIDLAAAQKKKRSVAWVT